MTEEKTPIGIFPWGAVVKPFFRHDCDDCMFVMQRNGMEREGILPAGKCDVYVCPQGGYPTAIVRNGVDGEYRSADRYLSLIYAYLREYHGEGGEEVIAVAKSYLRHEKKRLRYL